MSRINKYASRSQLMDIHISLGSEVFRFNLYEELVISEARINQEILEQSSSYAFLGMLHKKLLRAVKDAELEVIKEYNQGYIRYKKEINDETGKPINDDLAKAKAATTKEYAAALARHSDLSEKTNLIKVCVDAFESRKDLIQTISANLRKEH
jgi:hypothetical protein